MRDIERKRNSQHWNLSFSLSGVDLYGLVCISCFFILDIFMLICELQCLCCMICNTCLLNAICIATILLINAYMTSISITVWRDGMSEFSSSLKASVFDLLSYMQLSGFLVDVKFNTSSGQMCSLNIMNYLCFINISYFFIC